jgi:hypothetical protein
MRKNVANWKQEANAAASGAATANPLANGNTDDIAFSIAIRFQRLDVDGLQLQRAEIGSCRGRRELANPEIALGSRQLAPTWIDRISRRNGG